METTMNKINLIDGQFTVNEAKEVLLDYLNKSINHNKIKNFSSQVRFGVDDEKALESIEFLKEQADYLSEILKEAHQNSKMLKINSFVKIEYVD